MAVRVPKNKPVIVAGTTQVNPTTATNLADTGAIAQAGVYEFRVYLGATAAALFDVQVRNATNSATSKSLLMYAAAGQTGCYPVSISLETGERVRVMMGADLTGSGVVALNYEKLG